MRLGPTAVDGLRTDVHRARRQRLTMIRGISWWGRRANDTTTTSRRHPTKAWFAYLDSLNVEWVGSLDSLFSNDLVDVTVHTRERPAQRRRLDERRHIHRRSAHDAYQGAARPQQEGLLDPRIRAAKMGRRGMAIRDPRPSLDCGLPTYKRSRYQWGAPKFSFIDNRCVVPSLWFWDVDHPTHAAKVGQFFHEHGRMVAVRYAKLAQTLGVEMYSLGTETEQLWRTNANEPQLARELQAMVNACPQGVSRTADLRPTCYT
jgi:hypothetical protein